MTVQSRARRSRPRRNTRSRLRSCARATETRRGTQPATPIVRAPTSAAISSLPYPSSVEDLDAVLPVDRRAPPDAARRAAELHRHAGHLEPSERRVLGRDDHVVVADLDVGGDLGDLVDRRRQHVGRDQALQRGRRGRSRGSAPPSTRVELVLVREPRGDLREARVARPRRPRGARQRFAKNLSDGQVMTMPLPSRHGYTPDGAKYWLRLPVRGVISSFRNQAPSPLACACTSASSSDTSMRWPAPVLPRTSSAASTPVTTSSEVMTSTSGTVTRTGAPVGSPFSDSRPGVALAPGSRCRAGRRTGRRDRTP